MLSQNIKVYNKNKSIKKRVTHSKKVNDVTVENQLEAGKKSRVSKRLR